MSYETFRYLHTSEETKEGAKISNISIPGNVAEQSHDSQVKDEAHHSGPKKFNIEFIDVESKKCTTTSIFTRSNPDKCIDT
jgi:hypothetical protein